MSATTYGPYDEDYPPPIGFTQWADLSARLFDRSRGEQLGILDTADVDPALWDACNSFWAKAMAMLIRKGELAAPSAFAARCAEELDRRRSQSGVGGTSPEMAVPVVEPLPFTGHTVSAPPAAAVMNRHRQAGHTLTSMRVEELEFLTLPFDGPPESTTIAGD